MGILLDLTIIFAIAALVLYLSARVRIPTIVGLLISGFIAGPHGFGLVKATEEVELLAEIGILLLLFTIGMEFSLEKLLKTRKWIFAGGGLQVLLTTGLIFLVSRLFGMTWQQSLFAGFLFSLSSTAIVMHLLQEKGKMDSKYGRNFPHRTKISHTLRRWNLSDSTCQDRCAAGQQSSRSHCGF